MIYLLTIFLIINTGLFTSNAANAMEANNDSTTLSSVLVAEPVDQWDAKDEITLIQSDLPSFFTTITISHSSVIPNSYIKSSSAHQFQKGSILTVNSLAWAPANQNIQIGFVDAVTKKQYWTPQYAGGVISPGHKIKLNGPAGKYYIAIGTPKANKTSVNVIGHFNF